MKKHLLSTAAILVMAFLALGSTNSNTSNTNSNTSGTPKTPEKSGEDAAKAAGKAEEEYEQNGLVLLRKTLQGKRGEFGGEITGTVVNRRARKLSYAQISFNLYDENGAQVGNAIDNINGLEPGGKWNFKANTFGVDFSTYKIHELSGF